MWEGYRGTVHLHGTFRGNIHRHLHGTFRGVFRETVQTACSAAPCIYMALRAQRCGALNRRGAAAPVLVELQPSEKPPARRSRVINRVGRSFLEPERSISGESHMSQRLGRKPKRLAPHLESLQLSGCSAMRLVTPLHRCPGNRLPFPFVADQNKCPLPLATLIELFQEHTSV